MDRHTSEAPMPIPPSSPGPFFTADSILPSPFDQRDPSTFLAQSAASPRTFPCSTPSPSSDADDRSASDDAGHDTQHCPACAVPFAGFATAILTSIVRRDAEEDEYMEARAIDGRPAASMEIEHLQNLFYQTSLKEIAVTMTAGEVGFADGEIPKNKYGGDDNDEITDYTKEADYRDHLLFC